MLICFEELPFPRTDNMAELRSEAGSSATVDRSPISAEPSAAIGTHAAAQSTYKRSRLRGHADAVTTIVVNPHNPAIVATSSEDKTVRIWRAPTTSRASLAILRGADEPVGAVAFDQRQNNKIYASNGIRVLEYDLPAAALEATADAAAIEPSARMQFNGDEIACLSAHPTQPLLAAADDDGAIVIINTITRTASKLLRKGHTSLCSSVHFRPCRAAVADWHTCNAHVAGAAAGRGVHAALSRSAASSTEPAELVSGGFDHVLVAWNASRGAIRSSMHVAQSVLAAENVVAVALAPPAPTSTADDGTGNAAAAHATAEDAAADSTSKYAGLSRKDRREMERKDKKLAAKAKKSSGTPAPVAAPPPPLAAAPAPAAASATAVPQMVNPPFVHAVSFSPCGAYVASALGDGQVVVCAWDDEGSTKPPQPLWWTSGHSAAATCVGFARHCRKRTGPPTAAEATQAPAASSAATVEHDHHHHRDSGPGCGYECGLYLYSAGNDGYVRGWLWEEVLRRMQLVARIIGHPAAAGADDGDHHAASMHMPAVGGEGGSDRASLPAIIPAFTLRHGRGPNCVAATALPRTSPQAEPAISSPAAVAAADADSPKSSVPGSDVAVDQPQQPQARHVRGVLLIGDTRPDVFVYSMDDVEWASRSST